MAEGYGKTGMELSDSDEWQQAWKQEISGKEKERPGFFAKRQYRLSEYGASEPVEGFAEFGRLVYTGLVPLQEVRRRFPKCAEFFQKQELWPTHLEGQKWLEAYPRKSNGDESPLLPEMFQAPRPKNDKEREAYQLAGRFLKLDRLLEPEESGGVGKKTLSYLNISTGGALVPPPAWKGPRPRRRLKKLLAPCFKTLPPDNLTTQIADAAEKYGEDEEAWLTYLAYLVLALRDDPAHAALQAERQMEHRGKSCIPNKIGEGHHDSETGHPCSVRQESPGVEKPAGVAEPLTRRQRAREQINRMKAEGKRRGWGPRMLRAALAGAVIAGLGATALYALGSSDTPLAAGVRGKIEEVEGGDPRRQETIQKLKTMKEAEIKPIARGTLNFSSRPLKVRFEDGSHAVYKPAAHESPKSAWYYNVPRGTGWRREMASQDVAELMGLLDSFPATTVRDDLPQGIGTVQEWLEGSIAGGKLTDARRYGKDLALVGKLAAFDYLTGNQDRHDNNWMVDPDNNLKIIDHGLSFPEHDFYDNYRWTRLIDRAVFFAASIPMPDLTGLRPRWGKLERKLKARGLSSSAIQATKKRFDNLTAKKYTSWREVPAITMTGKTLGDMMSEDHHV